MKTTSRTKDVYRVRLDGLGDSCRSRTALLVENVSEIAGVEAVTVSVDGTLVAVASQEYDLFDLMTRAVVRSGLDPTSVSVSTFDRKSSPLPVWAEDAAALGLTREPTRAAVETVQRASITVSDGYYPDELILAAGIPTEITFSEGHGCLARVVFPHLGIEADLDRGGAVVWIPALEVGEYEFRCGMDMVHGRLIVE